MSKFSTKNVHYRQRFPKAFIFVIHTKRLCIPVSFCIRLVLIILLASYFFNRSSGISLNTCLFCSFFLFSCVTQGSILAPLPFLSTTFSPFPTSLACFKPMTLSYFFEGPDRLCVSTVGLRHSGSLLY